MKQLFLKKFQEFIWIIYSWYFIDYFAALWQISILFRSVSAHASRPKILVAHLVVAFRHCYVARAGILINYRADFEVRRASLSPPPRDQSRAGPVRRATKNRIARVEQENSPDKRNGFSFPAT